MSKTDELSQRLKSYEGVEAQRRLNGQTPICIRLDGRGFSRFSRGFDKPFDPAIAAAMRAAARTLIDQTHARAAFVQSDEISLVLEAAGPLASVIFDGRVQKLTSILASVATLTFALELSRTHPAVVLERRPVFDGRAWQVPSRVEAANTLLWRAQDARKNGISAAARRHFSFRELQNRSGRDMLAMLAARGIDYATAYAAEDRLGVFYRRVSRQAPLDSSALLDIPERHHPRVDADSGAPQIITRSVIEELPPIYFGDILNRPEVIFDGAEPRLRPDVRA